MNEQYPPYFIKFKYSCLKLRLYNLIVEVRTILLDMLEALENQIQQKV